MEVLTQSLVPKIVLFILLLSFATVTNSYGKYVLVKKIFISGAPPRAHEQSPIPKKISRNILVLTCLRGNIHAQRAFSCLQCVIIRDLVIVVI